MRENHLTLSNLPLTAVVFLLIVGFLLRIHNLGLLGLIVDEGTQALAVEGIFKYGYPIVPSGMVYARSPVYLYSQFVSALTLGLNEFSLRLPSVLFNVGSIILVYYFGRSLFDTQVGLLSALILTFSAWEIELSRVARMYTAFQFLYLLSLFIFYHGFINGRRLCRLLVPVVFLLTFSMHPIGVTLLTIFLVPLFIESYHVVKKTVLLLYMFLVTGSFFIYHSALSLLISNVTLHTFKGGDPGNSIDSLIGVKQLVKTTFNLPHIGLLKEVFNHNSWFFILICALGLSAIGFVIYSCWVVKSDRMRWVLSLPIIICYFFYQFGLGIVLFYLYGLLFLKDRRSVKDRAFFAVVLSGVAALLAWSGYVLFYPPNSYFSFVDTFWGYPPVYPYFLKWFLEGWPRLTGVTGIGVVVLTSLHLRDKTAGRYIFCLLGIALPVVLASLVSWRFYSSRYVFHLYPLIVIVFAFTVSRFSGWIVNRVTGLTREVHIHRVAQRTMNGIALVLLTVFLSQDVYPSEALGLTEATYKTWRGNNVKAYTNDVYGYYHQDYKGPADFVKKHMQPDDVIIVMGKAHVPVINYHYIGKVDYVLMEKAYDFYGRQRENGIVHYITGSEVITNVDGLERILEKNRSRNIWLLADVQVVDGYYSENVRDALNRSGRRLVFIGEDEKTLVCVIDAKRGV